MKKVYVGTQLEEPAFRDFAVRAAQAGLSKSALLKKLALEFVKKSEAGRPRRKRHATTTEAAA